MTSTMTTVKEAISFPVLTYTDALPRGDLFNLSDGRYEPGNIPGWDAPRPETSDGQYSKDPPPFAAAAFDFRLTAPPDEAVPSSARSDGSPLAPHMIGIALGSPGMLNSQESLLPPRFNTSIFTQEQKEESSSSGKPSKWKKIGGLFRTKNALASPTKAAGQKHSSMKDKPFSNKTPNEPESMKRAGSTKGRPRIDLDARTTATANNSTSNAPRSRNFSMSGRKASRYQNLSEVPQLELNIPDAHMDRFMPNNCVNQNQKSSLLARRSKTLDNLRVPNAEPFLAAKGLPVPRRRATSPARSNFTLFPTSHPPKAAKILGTQQFSRGPNPPLTRASTLHVKSPSKASLDPPRVCSNTNSTSSLDSQFFSDVFTERSNTPSSLNNFTRIHNKPLPAIKTEPKVQSRPHKLSPQAIRAAQGNYREQRHADQQKARDTQKTPKTRPDRLDLTIDSEISEFPQPPTKHEKTNLSMTSNISDPTPQPQKEQRELTISPEPTQSILDPSSISAQPYFFPLVAEPEEINDEHTPETPDRMSTIEVSTARSISVKRSKRQMLVPIGARADHLSSNERFVEGRALTPTITDVRHGHKHAVSQELQIESL